MARAATRSVAAARTSEPPRRFSGGFDAHGLRVLHLWFLGPMTPKTEVTQTTDTDREVRLQKAYDAARRRALARLRKGYELRFTPPRSRDDLHER